MTYRRGWRVALIVVLSLTWAGIGASTVTASVSNALLNNEPSVTSHRDFAYAEDVARPTADKPQSKLWFAHDSWWALMANSDDGAVHVFELTGQHNWRDTGVVVDARIDSTGDVLWNGDHAYVASRTRDGALTVSRLSFDVATRTWSRVGSVVEVASGGSASVTIAEDTRGRLWITYVQKGQVLVAHTTVGDRRWTAPFTPNVPNTLVSADDISSVVALDGEIGVMWSDQLRDRFVFAVHANGDKDSEWTAEVASRGYLEVDDHLSLQTAPSAEGTRVFVAVKTSLDEISGGSPLLPQIAVLVRDPGGEWTAEPAGTLSDGHTRPILVVDASNEAMYLLAAVEGAGVVYKRSPLDDISFADGVGESLIASSGQISIADATSSKAAVTAESGLVVLADAAGINTYFHAEVSLPEPPIDADLVMPRRPDSLVASTTTGCQVELAWPPAEDNVSVMRYDLSRDGRPIAAVTSPGYTDVSAGCGATHLYAVSAVDTSGNISQPREADLVTTPDRAPGRGVWLAGSSSAVTAGSTRSLSLPTPPAKRGDVMFVSVDALGAPAMTAPAGWRPIQRNVQPDTLVKSTYVRVATGEEPAVLRWSFDRPTTALATALAYRGAAAADWVVSTTGQSNDTSELVETSSVTPGKGQVVIGLFTVAGLATVTPPADMVPRVSETYATSEGQAITSRTAELGDLTAPSSAPAAAISEPLRSIGQLIVLRGGRTK